MAKRAATLDEPFCPICRSLFKTSRALEQHSRDKNDAAHAKFRADRSAESEQPTAKKARGAFDQVVQTFSAAGETFSAAGAKLSGSVSYVKAVIFPSTSNNGNLAAAASNAKQDPSPTLSRSVTPRIPEKDLDDPESQEIAMQQEQEIRLRFMPEELNKLDEDKKTAKQQVQDLQAKVTELQQESQRITRQNQTCYDQGQRRMQHKLDNAGEEFKRMQKQNEALQKKNNELNETINELRAMSSAATPGNDNINAKFPFKSEIVKSYSKIVKVVSCLLDPCWDSGDILWACAVSKLIFTACQECALDSTRKPQKTFQEVVKAGEGADWERTRWEMTKLQRTTRAIVLSDFKGNAIESWVQSERTETNGDVARLLSHKDYKPASLEECMYQLMKVLMDAALDEPSMAVDLNTIKKQTSFDKERHEVLEGHLKKGEPCIIVFPKLHPHNEAKAYVMPYDKPEEIPDTDEDEQTLMDLEEDDGSAVGGGGGKGRGEAGGASDDSVGRGASTENK